MDLKEIIKVELGNKEFEDIVIENTIEKAKSYIKRYCNIEEIPKDLDYVIVDMAVKIIENKYSSASGEKEVKSKTMGDTSITYNTVTRKEHTYDEIVGQFSSELNNYRCLRW